MRVAVGLMSKWIHAPCQNCKDRHVGCHGNCEIYLAYANESKKKKLEWMKQYAADHDADAYTIRMTLKQRKKNGKE